jgi:hypothetical protein
MPFQEDFEEFLDESQGFASFAVITPALGKSYRVKGIFTNEYIDIDSGMAGFGGSNPVFECASKAVEVAEYGDLLTINKVSYRIVGIRPDGNGWVRLELERQN